MSKHTPGPWEVHDGFIFSQHLPGVRDSQVIGDARTGADARLIAAAPELLAALQAAIANEQEHGQDWQPWAQQAREAIAKAMGTQ